MKLDLKVLVRYHIQFKGKWISYPAIFAGVAFFLLCVHYFGLQDLSLRGAGEIIFSLIFPLLILFCFMVLFSGLRFSVTPVYGVICAAYCLFMIIRAFSSYGSAMGSIVALVWYVLALAVTLGTTWGYITSRLYMVLAFLLPALYRLVFIDISRYIVPMKLAAFLPEASALCGLLSISAFAICLKAAPIKVHEKKIS